MCQKRKETTDDYMGEMAQTDLCCQTEIFEPYCLASYLGYVFHGLWLSFS
jgi:hypothetical protein